MVLRSLAFAGTTAFAPLLLPAQDSLVRFPYLDGGQVVQIDQGAGFLFAGVGVTPASISKYGGGMYLYRRASGDSAWRRIARSDSVGTASIEGTLRFAGALGNRAFFNLDGPRAFFTDDGGDRWNPLGDRSFQSNVTAMGSTALAVFDDVVHGSQDQGRSWQPLSPARLDATRLVPLGSFLYAGISPSPGFNVPDIHDTVWISADTGRTWQKINAGLPASDFFNMLAYDGKILCATRGRGVFWHQPGKAEWELFGQGSEQVGEVFSLGGELFGQAVTRHHRYNPDNGIWEQGQPPWNDLPAGIFVSRIHGFTEHAGSWLIGHMMGLVAYNPSTGKTVPWDRGILHAVPRTYAVVGNSVVAPHQAKLYFVPPDGEPAIFRDLLAVKDSFPLATIENVHHADSSFWIRSRSSLLRYSLATGTPRLRDSVPVSERVSRFFCDGDDIVNLAYFSDSAGRALDTAHVRVSRDGGARFLRWTTLDLLAYPDLRGAVGAYIQGDAVWVWDGNAGSYVIERATGAIRAQSGNWRPPPSENASMLRIPGGVLFVSGQSVMHTRDGLDWSRADSGLPGNPIRRIQSLEQGLFTLQGNSLYFASAGTFTWKARDLSAWVGPRDRVEDAVVGPEGIYLAARDAEGIVLIPWSETGLLSIGPGIPRVRKGPGIRLLQTRQGILIEKDRLRFSVQGRRQPVAPGLPSR